jgi:hypothetical protein
VWLCGLLYGTISNSASRPGRFTSGETAPWYPLERRLDGLQNWSERRGEEEILDCTRSRTPTHGHPARSQSLYYIYILTILFMLAAEGCGPGFPRVSCPLATFLRRLLCASTIICLSLLLVTPECIG